VEKIGNWKYGKTEKLEIEITEKSLNNLLRNMVTHFGNLETWKNRKVVEL